MYQLFLKGTLVFLSSTLITNKIIIFYNLWEATKIDEKHPIYRITDKMCEQYCINKKNIKLYYQYDIISPISHTDFSNNTHTIIMPKWYLDIAENNINFEVEISDDVNQEKKYDFYLNGFKLRSMFLDPKNLDNNMINESINNINSFNKRSVQGYLFAIAHEIGHFKNNRLIQYLSNLKSLINNHSLEYECDNKAAKYYRNEGLSFFGQRLFILLELKNVIINSQKNQNDKVKLQQLFDAQITKMDKCYSHPSSLARLKNIGFSINNIK